ncbi:MAG: hypothetical protein RMZ69_17795 [Nostoc sp. ChiQUE01a]|nr:hypothetical protein [Nostoc sp. ChiQUE01a]
MPNRVARKTPTRKKPCFWMNFCSLFVGFRYNINVAIASGNNY